MITAYPGAIKPLGEQWNTSHIVHTKANLAEARSFTPVWATYRYLNGSSALHTRTEIGILVVGVLLSVCGDLRLLENHPNKQAIVYGFLKEAGLAGRKGNSKRRSVD